MDAKLLCDEILPLLVKDFGKLWHCKPRGDSLEIITPFSTITQKFVSVFITKRNGEIVISDGGFLDDDSDQYGIMQSLDEADSEYFIEHFRASFRVSSTLKPNGDRVFFKKCNKSDLLSSALYDVCNFVLCVANSTPKPSDDALDSEQKKSFRQQANGFLTAKFPSKVTFGRGIDGLERVKFSAVVNPTPSSMALIIYVTGSTPYYFSSDLRRAIVNFELANSCRSQNHIRTRLALLDNDAEGYVPAKNTELMQLLGTHKGRGVNWSERDSVVSLVEG